MTTNEMEKVIKRLKGAFAYNRFDEDEVSEEYQRFIAKHPFQAITAAIDILIESDSQRVPPISAIIKMMRELNKPTAVSVSNSEHCYICDNKGFILMTETESKLDNRPYEYALHCTCQIGRSQSYSGKNCKKEQTAYKVPCVTEYFDDYAIDQMKKANMNKKKLEITDVQEIKAQCLHGMPDLKLWEKGDAWEI